MIRLVFRRLLVREERKNLSSTSCAGGSESTFNKLKKTRRSSVILTDGGLSKYDDD